MAELPGVALNEAEAQRRADIHGRIARLIAAINNAQLMNRFPSEAGRYNRVVAILESVKPAVDVPHLPGNLLQTLDDSIREIDVVIDQCVRASKDATAQREGSAGLKLLGELDAAHHRCFVSAIPVLAYQVLSQKDLQAAQKLSTESIGRIYQSSDAMAEMVKQAEAALASIRSTAADAGIARHAQHFATEAEEHETSARRWLWAMIAIGAAATILILVLGLFTAEQAKAATSTTPYLVQLGVTKLAVLSLFYYAIVWAGKNYRSHLHNRAVNRHRYNALKTFEAFLAAAHDRSTKDAVLLHLTQSIFAPQATGHISGDSEAAGPTHIVEMFTKRDGG